MEDFKVGDVVVLKSGGPNMTVTNSEGDKVEVRWFHSLDNNLQMPGYFPKEALCLVPPDKSELHVRTESLKS